MIRSLKSLLLLVLFSICAFPQVRIDEVVNVDSVKVSRERGLNMLSEIKDVLKQYYYDKKFRGIEIDARFKKATEVVKSQNTNAEIFQTIAEVLLEFNDSHTRFYPPSRSNRVEYGFTMQMIGDNCFVTSLKAGSDAEAKGLKVGDRIKAIGSFKVDRSNLWVLEYFIYSLAPQPAMSLTVEGLDKAERRVSFVASFKTLEDRKKEREKKQKEKRENPYRCSPIDQSLIVCKLETFSVDKKFIDKMMDEASKYSKLVLDLRGNGGGHVKIEEYLTGHFFDREIKIANFVSREKTKERIAKPQKDRGFKGELVVLIDSDSASASEVFARVIQLEKRGKIVGDVSAGAVMTSYIIPITNSRGLPGYQTLSVFAVSVTVADLIMSDGNRLENVGVIPDHPVGPTAFALSKRSDPILSFAAKLLKSNLSPEDAGKMNFLHKKDEDEDKETDGDDGEN